MPSLLLRFLTSTIRYWLAYVLGWLEAHDVINLAEGELDEYALALAGFLAVSAWSMWEKYKDQILFYLARGLHRGTPVATIKALAANPDAPETRAAMAEVKVLPSADAPAPGTL